VKWSERVYRWLLCLYPRDFRDEYGQEMSLLFRARTADGPGRLWLQVLGDAVFHAPREHWSTMKQDLRYALRALKRTPTFTLAVTATLALGIGANSVVFSAVDAVLLRDAPVSNPDTVVSVFTSDSSGRNPYGDSSYPDYFDLRDSGTFASLASYATVPLTIDAHGQTEAVAGQLVSGNYFDVLGVRIAAGRAFGPDEDQRGAPVRVAVMSHVLWQRLFNADSSVIGRMIRLDSEAYTLIGVAPRGFSGLLLGTPADVWVPAALQPRTFDLRRSRGLSLVGRLPKGTSAGQAVWRADVISSRLQAAYPDTNTNRRFTVAPLGEGRGLRVEARRTLRLLSGAALIVLLVACVNVASLLLVRAMSREREVAVRVAIGASRRRLVRQWLTESALLGIFGSIGAVLVTLVSTPLLHAFVIPETVDLSVNTRVLAYTLAVGVGAGLLFGLAPAFQARRQNPIAWLRAGGLVVAGPRTAKLRGAFVVLQVSLSLVLLVGAGLFVRTLKNAYAVDLGYQIDQILVASLDLPGAYAPDAGVAAYDQILARVGAVPGVVTASAARTTVLSGGAHSTAVSTDGLPIEKDRRNALSVRANVISQRYFETLGIRILRGRSFDESDGPQTPRVAIVTRSLAERLWLGSDPIGQTLRDEGDQPQVVVGVVPDTVYRGPLERETRPAYYLLLAQNYRQGVALHVRGSGSPALLVAAIRDAVRQVDSRLAVDRPQLLRDVLDRSLSQPRMLATLGGLFGAIALALTVCGLYGVMAHVVAQRTPEIGLRLAMGAPPTSVVALLMGQGLRMLGIGAIIGVAVALLGTRYIAAQLFGVTATDPLTFVGGLAVLAVSGLAASGIPALRAMRVDPVIVLRQA
jgi:putative ABC transport system permease protein